MQKFTKGDKNISDLRLKILTGYKNKRRDKRSENGLTLGKTYKVDGEWFTDDLGHRRHTEWFTFKDVVLTDEAVEVLEEDTEGATKLDGHTSLTFHPLDKAMRFNSGKTPLSYMLDADVAMAGMCRVMEFGAKKYARGNWKKGLDPVEVMDSLLRHLTSYQSGEVLDPESSLPHIDHVLCNAVFLSTFGKREE